MEQQHTVKGKLSRREDAGEGRQGDLGGGALGKRGKGLGETWVGTWG